MECCFGLIKLSNGYAIAKLRKYKKQISYFSQGWRQRARPGQLVLRTNTAYFWHQKITQQDRSCCKTFLQDSARKRVCYAILECRDSTVCLLRTIFTSREARWFCFRPVSGLMSGELAFPSSRVPWSERWDFVNVGEFPSCPFFYSLIRKKNWTLSICNIFLSPQSGNLLNLVNFPRIFKFPSLPSPCKISGLCHFSLNVRLDANKCRAADGNLVFSVFLVLFRSRKLFCFVGLLWSFILGE